VNPEQSEKLALAQNQGTIHFVLRNSGDAVNPDVAPVDLAQLAGIPKAAPKAPATHSRPAAPAVKVPEFYSVETVTNGKSTISKFPVIPE